MPLLIDLYSDTVTRPTAGMRKAIAEAEVGDEQKGEDPTTRRLEDKVAELLGHSSALFFPSATMANEVALLLHCRRGDELVAADQCHLFFAEAGGPAVHAGVMTRPIPAPTGVFTGEDVRRQYRTAKGSHYPVTRLVSVENTTNMGGGIAWPMENLTSVLDTAKELGLNTHLDGARLMNAAVKLGVSPDRIAGRFDSATLCLSKGLGAPAGAVLAFDKTRWHQVRLYKQRMGGALRQSGILAAAGLYALENHVTRLAEDHAHAQLLAQGLSGIDVLDPESPSTNMVFFRWRSKRLSCPAFLDKCLERGLRMSEGGDDRVRAVTHLDISRPQIDQALKIIQDVCKEAS